MYNKELVWIFHNFMLIWLFAKGELTIGSDSSNQIDKSAKEINAHSEFIIPDYFDLEIANTTVISETTDPIKDNICEERKKDDYSVIVLEKQPGDFVKDPQDPSDSLPEEEFNNLGKSGHFDGCHNHGSCYRHGNDFSCCCYQGYTGRDCELEIFTSSTPVYSAIPTSEKYMPSNRPFSTSPTDISSNVFYGATTAEDFAADPITMAEHMEHKTTENTIISPPTAHHDDESLTQPTRPVCYPVNNCSAHYTCDRVRGKSCLPGWKGDNCDQLIPDSQADCTVYEYGIDFIKSDWQGSYQCDNDTTVNYTLTISVSDIEPIATFLTKNFSVVMGWHYNPYSRSLILANDKSGTILLKNYTRISVTFTLNTTLELEGTVHFSTDGAAAEDCESNLQRISAYFDGCNFHGDCYRYGKNRTEFHCCCEQGFHGKFCEKKTITRSALTATNCVPVNNCSAHYTCRSDGSKLCLPGWEGENCDQMIPGSVADCSSYDFIDCPNPPLRPNSNATASYQTANGLKHATISCINEAGILVQDELDCKKGNWTIYAEPHCLARYKLVTQSPSVYRPIIQPFPSRGPHSLHCSPITSLANGKVTMTGLVVRFTCDGTFNLLGTSTLECVGGNWNDNVPICSVCESLGSLQQGKIVYNSGETFDIAVFSCSEGFTLNGAAATYCLNGVWSSETITTCVPKASSCIPLGKIENGLVTMDGLSNGSQAVYSCHEGYNIVGPVIRYCINGIWTEEDPFCRITDCRLPPSPGNGEVTTLGGTTYGSLAVYSCNLGYYTNDTRSRVCLANGAWSNNVPTCHVIDCGQLTDPANGFVKYMSEDGSKTGYQSVAVYSCSEGYSVLGFISRICLASGRWSGEAPECIQSIPDIMPCPRHIDSWGTTWGSTLPGQTSSLQCKGENNIGQITRHCSLAGQWALPVYNCVRKDIVNIQQQVEELQNNPSSAGVTHTLDQLANVTASDEKAGELQAGELETISDSLDRIASISETGMLITEEQSQAYIRTASNMFDQRNAQSWQALSQSETSTGASRVLQSIDRMSEAITRTLEHGNKTEISLIQSNIVMQVKKISRDQQNIAFPDATNKPDWLRGSGTGFNLPLQLNTALRSYTGVFYRDMVSIFPSRSLSSRNDSQLDSNKTLNSPILSLQLFPDMHNMSRPLELTFNHQNLNFRNASCSYWNFKRNLWETDGCYVKTSSEAATVCECSHLTNFAVLMSPWDTKSDASTVIEVISIVGCSISIVCLLITLSTHMVVWRYVKSDRVIILMNLCIALTASYIIFLAGVNQTQNKDACTAVAALLQYIYLVVFFLMLAEGIEIAITVLYVFLTKSRIKWILPAAWGIPAVIVGIALGITKLEGYGTKNFCWLSVENGLIWAFVGPAVFIILVNVIFLILVLRAMLSSKAIAEKTDKEKIKCSLRCLCVLLPLMGCTWVLGIFYVNERMVWIQYLFAICNSLQGFFIFLFHGFLNKQLRTAIRRKQKKYRDSATTSKELSRTPKEIKREKPVSQTNGATYSEPVHLLSFEKRRSTQTSKTTVYL